MMSPIGAFTAVGPMPQHERAVTYLRLRALTSLTTDLRLLGHGPEVLTRVTIIDRRNSDLLLRMWSLSRVQDLLLLLMHLRRLLRSADLLSDGRRHGAASGPSSARLLVQRVRMEYHRSRLLIVLLLWRV